ncbi:MAG: LD-carboxypeptidase [bacterium]|nr:LD-carboxypeptidase [bacterium]
MIKPYCLKPGDTVGVVAPSDAVDKVGVEHSAQILKKWGLKVVYGKYVFAKVGDFMAGTAEERQEDLRTMIADNQIKAIWAASGGYAATEVLPVFNKETITQLQTHPKWFIGYSDVCLILNVLTSFKLVSIMGPGLWGLSEWDVQSQEILRKMLFGEAVSGIGSSNKWKAAISGIGEGYLVASNLEGLIFSFGTRFDPFMYGGNQDIILALEELDIDKSTLQRQIDIVLSHKRSKRIKGVVVGRLTNIKEFSYPEWGKKVTPQGLVTQRVKKLGVPLAFLEDFGHAEWDYGRLAEIKKHFANRRFISLPNGVKVRLTVKDGETGLEYLEEICQPSPESLTPLKV